MADQKDAEELSLLASEIFLVQKMFSSEKFKSSSNSVDTDTIELFSREDIRFLKPKNRLKSTHNIIGYPILSILLLLIISLCALTLYRFSHLFSAHIEEPNISFEDIDNNSSDFIFKSEPKVTANHFVDQTNLTLLSTTGVGPQCQDIEPNNRFDCNPDQPISKDVCLRRGCCWRVGTVMSEVVNNTHIKTQNKPPLGVPTCYYGPDYVGYEVTTVESYHYRTVVTLNRKIGSGFIRDSQTVKIEIIELNDFSVRIKFYDPNERRYEVPIPVLNLSPEKTIDNPLFKVKVLNGVLLVVRQKTSTPIFKTDLKRLVFSDQFLQLSSDLPSDYVYGIGEHRDTFRKSAKQWKRYTLFNKDQVPVPNMNLYSSHPFYLSVEDTYGHSSGVFLFNSNSMDVILQPKPAITWRTIGGILDFYVLFGPQPKDVIRQYSELVGFTHLPPYWALGFHLCKYGYNSLDTMIDVFNRTRSAGIPYDVQWNDIDAMKARLDFSYDDQKFKDLPKFVQNLHKIGMKYIPMFDPGISASEKPGTYPPYDLGMSLNIFVKNSSGQPFIGKVWPGNTVWPDFTDPKTVIYWTAMFEKYHKEVEYDGAWIDMNDPSNFLDGATNGCPQNSLENPQYIPGSNDNPLRTHTFCMNTRHFAGLHYDLHNLYGFSEAIVTNEALKTVLRKRPVIISRSTSPGHGKYAGHWDGDVISDWDSMRWTIASILNFNLFAIPLVGADICGFNGNTTVELCARWSALGAFYPFSRNHNSDDTIPQDPTALGPVVTAAAKNALELRYSLLPYLYTLFFRSHTTGDTVVRPLFFEFPTDLKSYDIETQFLWGSGLMVVPTLYPNMTYVNAYLPPGLWYDFKRHTTYQSSGQIFKLDSPITEINLLVRSGHILVTQQPKTTTEETHRGNFSLFVALDSENRANGSLFWDSGDGLDNLLLRQFDLIEFSAQNNSLNSDPKVNGYDISGQKLTEAIIVGVKTRPTSVLINAILSNNFKYDSSLKLLTINRIDAKMSDKNIIIWK